MPITLTEIEAIISLRDEVSGKLADINDKLGTLSDHADRTGNSVSGLGGMMTLATTAGNLLARGIESVGGAAVGAVTDAFKLNSTLETARLSFETLTGSSSKAQEIVASLFEFAAKTPFRTDEVIAASRTLQVFGGEALNTSERLTMVGNAAAATGAPIDQVSFWVGRMYASMAANKPIGEAIQNLMQLGVVSPEAANALTQVAASGKTVEEKFSVMEENLGRFTGAMEKQAASWTGVTSTFADTFALMMANAFEGAFVIARDALGNINAVLADRALQDAFGKIGEAIAGAFGSDQQEQVATLTRVVIGFLDGTLGGIEAAYRAWNFFKDAILGVTETIIRGASTFADVTVKLADMSTSLPVVGDKYKDFAMQARSSADELKGMAEQLKQQGQEAANAATGQTAFTTAIDNARAALATASEKVLAHADEQKRLADQGVVTGTTMAELEKTTTSLAGATQVATKEQQKHNEELAKLGGADKIAAADLMAQAIERDGLAAVVAANGIEKVHTTFETAANIARARGDEVKKPWTDAEFATLQADKALTTYKGGMDGVLTKATEVADAFPKNPPVLSMRQWDEEISRFVAGLPAVADAMTAPGQAFGTKFKEGFLGDAGMRGLGGDIGNVITQAITGGGDIGGAIGSLIGSKVGTGLNNAFQDMFQDGGALAGIANTGFGKVLGGAADAILPGVGGLLGQGLGAIFDGIFKTASKAANDMRDEFIASAGGFDELAAKAAAAGTTIEGVMAADSPEKLKRAIADLQAAFEEHKRVLEEWGAELQDVLSTGAMMTDELREKTVELMSRDLAGTQDTAWAFLQGEMAALAENFDDAVTTWAAPFEELRTQISDSTTSAEDLIAAQTSLSDWAATNQDDFQRFGSLAVGVYEQLQQGGMDSVDALAAMKPALENLATVQETLGLTSGATFDQMLAFTRLADEYAPLLRQIGSLDGTMVALHNTGLLTSSMFFDLAGQVTDTFNDMVAQGADGNAALQLIQPTLQRLWEMQQDFGWEVDAATQKLLDEAAASGVVGDQFRDAGDRMALAVEALLGRLDALITALGGDLPGAADTAVGKVNDAFGRINWEGVRQQSRDTFGQIGQDASDAAYNESVIDVADVINGPVLTSLFVLGESSTDTFDAVGQQAEDTAKRMEESLTSAADRSSQAIQQVSFVAGATSGGTAAGPGFDDTARYLMGALSFPDRYALEAQVLQENAAKAWKDWASKQALATQDMMASLELPKGFKTITDWLGAITSGNVSVRNNAGQMISTMAQANQTLDMTDPNRMVEWFLGGVSQGQIAAPMVRALLSSVGATEVDALRNILATFGTEAGKASITTQKEFDAAEKAAAAAAKAAEKAATDAAKAAEKAAADAAKAAEKEAAATAKAAADALKAQQKAAADAASLAKKKEDWQWAAGGLDALIAKAQAAGVDISAALDATTAEEFSAALRLINHEFSLADQAAKAAAAALKDQEKAAADAAKAAEKAAADAAKVAALHAQLVNQAQAAYAKLYGDSLTGLEKELYTLEQNRQKELASWASAPTGLEALFADAIQIINQKYDALVTAARQKAGVPAMASGGIVTDPTLAMVGEAGPEAVIPLSSLGTGFGVRQTILVQLDGRTLARTVARNLPRELEVVGVV